MDELCNMMQRNDILCKDENNELLHTSYEHLRNLLMLPIGLNHIAYLHETSDRYKLYLNRLKRALFFSNFRYIGESIDEFLQHVPTRSTPFVIKGLEIANVKYLLLLSHFIDGELLTALGGLVHQEEEE